MAAATSSSSSAITLYTHAMCPFAQKAWLALNFAKVPFEMEQIDLYGGKPSWFLKMNPLGQVPVLKISDKVITESEDILTFIGSDQFISDNLLQKTEKQSDVLYWREAIDSRLKVVGKKSVLSRSGIGKGSELGKILEELEQKYISSCSYANNDENFLAGKYPSLADCAAFPFLYRLSEEYKDGKHIYPHLMGDWLRLMESREEVRSTIQASWWWWW